MRTIFTSLALAAIMLAPIHAKAQAAAPPPASNPVVHSQRSAREIDFTQSLIGIDGKPLANQDPKAPPLTLGDVAIVALTGQLQGDNLSPVDKYKLGELAHKVYGNKHAHLTAEEITTLKDRIGRGYAPAIVYPALNILDPNEGK